MVAALEQCPRDGVPPNPGGWLMLTAEHRAIDLVRRYRTFAFELEPLGRDLVVDALVAAGALDTYPLRYAVRGDLLAQLGRNQQARAGFTRAAELTGNTSEQTLLRGRAAACADADQAVPGASP
ncbi:hypothetical protein LTT66_36255 [Nocardia gipuzkoensis]|nr:hypothetical protein [Nocardia gipuzkoensis]UGT68521.1 hypothetical protein LTT66_36255 [Nocardia gipuzkoensis]